MGMTIDDNMDFLNEAKDFIENVPNDPIKTYLIIESLETAIDTMRKYQKIEEAYTKYQNDVVTNIYADKKFVEALEGIFKNGNDD